MFQKSAFPERAVMFDRRRGKGWNSPIKKEAKRRQRLRQTGDTGWEKGCATDWAGREATLTEILIHLPDLELLVVARTTRCGNLRGIASALYAAAEMNKRTVNR